MCGITNLTLAISGATALLLKGSGVREKFHCIRFGPLEKRAISHRGAFAASLAAAEGGKLRNTRCIRGCVNKTRFCHEELVMPILLWLLGLPIILHHHPDA